VALGPTQALDLNRIGKRGGVRAEGLGTGPADLNRVDPEDEAGSGGRGGALGPIYGTRAASILSRHGISNPHRLLHDRHDAVRCAHDA
jgi:hypothetical protein